MALGRTNAMSWSVLDKLTSAQINAMNIADTYALDKRAGQSDTLGSVVTCSSAGRVIPTSSDGADANTSYTVVTAGSTILPGALTATRTYTLTNTSAVIGDRIVVLAHATQDILVTDAGATLLATVGPSGVPWAVFRFNGTAWTLLVSGPNLVVSVGLGLAIHANYLLP